MDVCKVSIKFKKELAKANLNLSSSDMSKRIQIVSLYGLELTSHGKSITSNSLLSSIASTITHCAFNDSACISGLPELFISVLASTIFKRYC
jgi:hypothetical protein